MRPPVRSRHPAPVKVQLGRYGGAMRASLNGSSSSTPRSTTMTASSNSCSTRPLRSSSLNVGSATSLRRSSTSRGPIPAAVTAKPRSPGSAAPHRSPPPPDRTRPATASNRGGDRQLNRALYLVAVTKKRCGPATKAYIARRLAEGNRTKSRPLHQTLPRPPCLATTRAPENHCLTHRSITRPSPDQAELCAAIPSLRTARRRS